LQSQIKDRHVQIRELFHLWADMKAGAPRSGKNTDEEREAAIVLKLLGLCRQEVFEAVAADEAGRVLCGLWLVIDPSAGKIHLRGNVNIVHAGITRTLRGASRRIGRNGVALVKAGVTAELAERRDGRIAVLRECKADEILPRLVRGVSQGLHYNMAVHVDHLAEKQRAGLLAALRMRLREESVVYIRMDREPEDPHEWLFWYIYHSAFARLVADQRMDGIPREVMVAPAGSVRSSQKGEAGVVFPLGPMFAHVYKEQAKELRKHGHPIKDYASVNRIAKSLKVHHDTATAWLKEDLPGLVVEPDGKGGVYYTFNVSTVRRSMEVARGKKRGPKTRSAWHPASPTA
jgi:hypothetical protein